MFYTIIVELSATNARGFTFLARFPVALKIFQATRLSNDPNVISSEKKASCTQGESSAKARKNISLSTKEFTSLYVLMKLAQTCVISSSECISPNILSHESPPISRIFSTRERNSASVSSTNEFDSARKKPTIGY